MHSNFEDGLANITTCAGRMPTSPPLPSGNSHPCPTGGAEYEDDLWLTGLVDSHIMVLFFWHFSAIHTHGVFGGMSKLSLPGRREKLSSHNEKQNFLTFLKKTLARHKMKVRAYKQ